MYEDIRAAEGRWLFTHRHPQTHKRTNTYTLSFHLSVSISNTHTHTYTATYTHRADARNLYKYNYGKEQLLGIDANLLELHHLSTWHVL